MKDKHIKSFHKIISFLMCIILITIFLNVPVQAKSYHLPKKVCRRVVGYWWSENSSGGYDVRFSRQKIKYYDRKHNKIVKVAKIKGCKVYKNGYLIKAQSKKYKYSYFISKISIKIVWNCILVDGIKM